MTTTTPSPTISKEKTIMVIPVYNHGPSLHEVASQALTAGWSVLIVDDGSTDGGPEAAVGLNVPVVTLPENRGKGEAILAGARAAWEMGYEAIITVDADGQHNPAEADLLLTEAHEHWPAMVIGNRCMEGKNIPGASRFGRSFSNFWVHIETGNSYPDTQSGMRLYPLRQLLQLSFTTHRFDFEIEALVRLAWAGVPVRSVPVSVHYPRRGERISHFNMLWDNIRLSLLHTRLVLTALLPIPHKRLIPRTKKIYHPNPFTQPLKFFRMLLNEHASPMQIAAAVWVGIFMGALPLIGIHTVAIIYICHRLHLNKVAAVAASQICMPPFIPLACIQTGFFLRQGHFLTSLNSETLFFQAGERFLEYFLGSLVIGPVIGIPLAITSFVLAGTLRKRQIAFDA